MLNQKKIAEKEVSFYGKKTYSVSPFLVRKKAAKSILPDYREEKTQARTVVFATTAIHAGSIKS